MKKIYFICFLLFASFLVQGQTKTEQLVTEGSKLHDEKKYEEAIQKYTEALELDNTSWFAHYEMAFTYYQMKSYEKTILHAEESIKNDKNSAFYAYIILGSAYDLIGKPKKAIKTYQKGIKKFPEMSLLYYNLALTYYNIRDVKNAEPNIIKAIGSNPNHSSSHLLLAYINNQKGERSKTVLSLYYFLMLEPDSPRSKDALQLLKELLKKGVTRRDNKNIDVSLNMNEDNEFGASDLMMSLLEASKTLEENEGKASDHLFYENTESFFTILGELNEKAKKKDFHKTFYVPYFKKMVDDGHVEAFSYYIQSSAKEKEILFWLEMNGRKINKFGDWFEKTKH